MSEVEKLQKNLYYKAIYMMLSISIIIATTIFLPLYLELKNDKNVEFNFTNQLKTTNIEIYFEELKSTALQITSRTKARELLIEFNNKIISLEKAKSEIDYILTDALNLSPKILGIMRFNINDILVSNVGISSPNIIKSKKVFITLENVNELITVIVNMPIIGRDGAMVGYDVVFFDGSELIHMINSYNSDNLKTYIGYFQDTIFKSVINSYMIDLKKSEILIDNRNIKEFSNSIIELNQIQDTNLTILTLVSKESLYSIINNQIVRLLILVILILIFGTIAIYLLSKPILNRLKNEIKKENEYKLELENRVKNEVSKRLEQERILIQQSKILSMAEMMSALAHQWRQPLNIIGLEVQNISVKFQDGELIESDIIQMEDIVMQEVKFLSQTITNFSNFFKPSRDKEMFNLIESIFNIIILTFDEFNKSSIKYEVIINSVEIELFRDNKDFIDKNKIMILGYKREFEHIILNIVLNSKDAILNSVELHKIVEGKITIEIETLEKSILINISDNGGGIEAKAFDKLFEPYFTTKFPSQGVGNSLYMAKILIEKNMNGKLSAFNNNFGATFKLEIPI